MDGYINLKMLVNKVTEDEKRNFKTYLSGCKARLFF